MTAPKSLYSWDVIVRKYLDKVFIDKRDEHNMLDNLTVNETSSDNQPTDDDSINGVRQLMQEAVSVNNSWRYQQYQKDKKIDLAEKDPFIEVEGQVAGRFGYMYKIWDLGNKRKICIRSTVQSLLAGADQIKFAFFSRKNTKSNTAHSLIGTYGLATNAFANQINLNMSNCWAILRDLVDSIYIDAKKTGEQSGEYIYMKDPNKALMRLFRVIQEEEEDEEAEEEL